MKPQELKQQLRVQRVSMDQHHATRLHRALSWMLAAEKYTLDDDIGFINLWISFNACYSAEDNNVALSDRASFRRFIERICEQDEPRRIYDLLWLNYSGFVRAVINNQFLFAPFWESHRNSDENWRAQFDKSQKAAMYALANQHVSQLLQIVLDRLYVLRNQVIHGGATHNSKVNREQVKSSRRLLAALMPVIIEVMLNDATSDWGEVRYPVVSVSQ